MRVLILTVQVPFVRGGAEILAEALRDALIAAGHLVEIVAVPFKWYPPEQLLKLTLACRLLDVSEFDGHPVDRVIGLKFPAYLVPHPAKVLWLLHQHRPAYDLWQHDLGGDLITWPDGRMARDAVRRADGRYIPEARAVYTISGIVSKRLKEYCGIDSTPIYHPPLGASSYTSEEPEDYFFFPSRLARLKRQALVIDALAKTRHPVRVRFADSADDRAFGERLAAYASTLGLDDRVRWLGRVSEEEKRRQYARALGVVYPPVDEDYGYVTLEAMLARRPVVTCADSGGPLDFVRDGVTGRVAEPTPEALAEALDGLWEERSRARRMGESGRELYDSLNISWAHVVERLLA